MGDNQGRLALFSHSLAVGFAWRTWYAAMQQGVDGFTDQGHVFQIDAPIRARRAGSSPGPGPSTATVSLRLISPPENL
jgi:hypothetical protein